MLHAIFPSLKSHKREVDKQKSETESQIYQTLSTMEGSKLADHGVDGGKESTGEFPQEKKVQLGDGSGDVATPLDKCALSHDPESETELPGPRVAASGSSIDSRNSDAEYSEYTNLAADLVKYCDVKDDRAHESSIEKIMADLRREHAQSDAQDAQASPSTSPEEGPRDQNNNAAAFVNKEYYSTSDHQLEAEFNAADSHDGHKGLSQAFPNPLLTIGSDDYKKLQAQSLNIEPKFNDHGDVEPSTDKEGSKGEDDAKHSGDGDNISRDAKAEAEGGDVEVEEIQAFLDQILGRQLDAVRNEKGADVPCNQETNPVSITLSKESDIDTSNSSSEMMESSKDTESEDHEPGEITAAQEAAEEAANADIKTTEKKNPDAVRLSREEMIALGNKVCSRLKTKPIYPLEAKPKKPVTKSKKRVRFKASTKKERERERVPRLGPGFPSRRGRWSPEDDFYTDYDERRYPTWMESPERWERAYSADRRKHSRRASYIASPPLHVISPPASRMSRMRWAQERDVVDRFESPPGRHGMQYKKRMGKSPYDYGDDAIYDDPWFDYYEYIPQPPMPPPGFRLARGMRNFPGSSQRSRSPPYSGSSSRAPSNESWRKNLVPENKVNNLNHSSSNTQVGNKSEARKTSTPESNEAEGPKTSLYVGDLHVEVTEAMLFEVFSEIGPLTSIRVCRDKFTRKSLGYGYVNFLNADDATKAHGTLNFTVLRGREIRLMWAERDPTTRQSGVGNLFVKNLDRSMTNKSLHNIFAPYGEILSSKIAFDERGQSRGYGFVHFGTEEASFNAILKMNGKLVNGRKLNVSRFKGRKKSEEEDEYDYGYEYEPLPVPGYPIFLPGTHPTMRMPMHDDA